MFRSSAAHEYLAQGTKRCLRDFYECVHTNNEEVFAGCAECRSPVGTSARAIGGGVSGPEPGSGDFVHAERSGADCVLEKVGRAISNSRQDSQGKTRVCLHSLIKSCNF